MRKANKKFKPVKPHGPSGDHKNDGFASDTRAYYQVYSPEDIRRTQADALRKLKEDFSGLKKFWNGISDVRRYFFVINDRYHGVYPDIYKEIARIKKKYKLEEADVFLAQDLERCLLALPDKDIFSIIGYVPDIKPAEFLFLSGFTYFAGAWIHFEQAISRLGYSARRVPTFRALRELIASAIISEEEFTLLEYLRHLRNPLFHGDSNKLPAKADIDRLVQITTRISDSLPQAKP
ncbi:MAG: hypothetical protein QOG71_3863 [Pyrinomonadaceae bacterium]|nr:hypothetical protein [Pyrinomonadaceae bacterium]